jgi:hypothetical protein
MIFYIFYGIDTGTTPTRSLLCVLECWHLYNRALRHAQQNSTVLVYVPLLYLLLIATQHSATLAWPLHDSAFEWRQSVN